jgi:hypothetical protein
MPPDQQPPHWRQYDAPGDEPGDVPQPESGPVSQVPTPFVPYGSGQNDIPGPTHTVPGRSSRSSRSIRVGSRGAMVGVVLGVGGAVVGVGVAVFAAVGGSGGLGGIGHKPDMHSQSEIDELVEDLKDDGAGTKAYSLTLYPDYAVVEIAVPGGSGQRYEGYYYDGSLDDDWGSGSNTSPEKTFDIADVDGTLLEGFCRDVTAMVDDAGDCYVIVDPAEDGSSLYSAYTSNDYSEGGYITYDADGQEVGRNQW